MVMENILLTRLYIKDNGIKVKNKVKVRLYLKVEVYFKVGLRMIRKKGMGKCIIIHQGIIFKGNGIMIRKKGKGR